MSRRCNTATLEWVTPPTTLYDSRGGGEPLTYRITCHPDLPDTSATHSDSWEINTAKQLESKTDQKSGVAKTLSDAASRGEGRYFDWMSEQDGGVKPFRGHTYSGDKSEQFRPSLRNGLMDLETPTVSMFFVVGEVSYRALFQNGKQFGKSLRNIPTATPGHMRLLTIGRAAESPDTRPQYEQIALLLEGGWTITTIEAKRMIANFDTVASQDVLSQPTASIKFSTVMTSPWSDILAGWAKEGSHVHVSKTPETLPGTEEEIVPETGRSFGSLYHSG